MRRKPVAWTAGLVGVLVLCVALAWAGSALWGLRLVPSSWLPRSHSGSGQAGPPTELARGTHLDRQWRLVGYTSGPQTCVESHVNGAMVTGQCGFREFAGQPGYSLSTTDLGSGTYLAFGPVPPSTATLFVRFEDGVRQRVPVQHSPQSSVSFFGITTQHQQEPLVAEARLFDAQGREIRV